MQQSDLGEEQLYENTGQQPSKPVGQCLHPAVQPRKGSSPLNNNIQVCILFKVLIHIFATFCYCIQTSDLCILATHRISIHLQQRGKKKKIFVLQLIRSFNIPKNLNFSFRFILYTSWVLHLYCLVDQNDKDSRIKLFAPFISEVCYPLQHN